MHSYYTGAAKNVPVLCPQHNRGKRLKHAAANTFICTTCDIPGLAKNHNTYPKRKAAGFGG